MFQLAVFFLMAAACAAPQNPQDVQIVRYDVNNGGLDSYNFAYVNLIILNEIIKITFVAKL